MPEYNLYKVSLMSYQLHFAAKSFLCNLDIRVLNVRENSLVPMKKKKSRDFGGNGSWAGWRRGGGYSWPALIHLRYDASVSFSPGNCSPSN